MCEQTFKIVCSPEHNPLKADEIKRLLWNTFTKSEWEVREIDQVDWQCGHSEKDAIQVMCPICEIAELRNRIEDKDADLAKQKAEITRLKQWCAYRNDRIVRMEKAIETAIEIIADSYDYDPKETYCECDCQAVNVLQRVLKQCKEGE